MMPGSSREIYENVQQITNTVDQSSNLQAIYESKNSEDPEKYFHISEHTEEDINDQLELLNNDCKNINNYYELPVDAVLGTSFSTSATSEPRTTETEKADTFAEKVRQ